LIEPARLAGGAVLRSQSDARLVDLVRAGNDRAFEAIVHRYRKPLLRYCGRFLPGPRAEDAVQQAFLNAYRAICEDERTIDLRPWLYRIAHNAALNVLRTASNRDTEPISEQIDGVERPDQAFERRERLADAVAAVQALPPRQRDAIVLRELEGRSYEEIATQLHLTGGAVRQLLNRARTTLRAGATAVAPEWLIFRLASGGGDPVAARVGEIVTAGGGVAVLAKAGTALVVAGAVVAGAGERAPGLSRGGDKLAPATAQAAEAPGGGATAPGSPTTRAISGAPSGPATPAGGHSGASGGPGGKDERGRPGRGSAGSGGGHGGSGGSGSGHGGTSTGTVTGDGSGSGRDDSSSDDGGHSGGHGSDSSGDAHPDGSGDSSGSGDGSGSDDSSVTTVPEVDDPPSPNSGSGSRDDSKSGGGGSSGSTPGDDTPDKPDPVVPVAPSGPVTADDR
jgi:RNA polymerase sigma factor (sigma-70 family)